MATDGVVLFMMGPGLLIGGALIILSLLLWTLALGRAIYRIGYLPLFVAYGAGFVGLVIINFEWAYFEYKARVSSGVLESGRWLLVLNWTIYLTLLLTPFILPLMVFVGAPLSAFLVRMRWLSHGLILLLLFIAWPALTLASWMWGYSNAWELAHPRDALVRDFVETFPYFAFVAGPFLLGIHEIARRRTQAPPA